MLSSPSYEPERGLGRAPVTPPSARPRQAEARFAVPTPTEFGLCVRARRHQLKIGQSDLAAQVGVGRQWIIALERGKASLELGLVLKTLAALNLDLQLSVWEPPAWAQPLTAAAGTRARPYGKGRLWRVRRKAAVIPGPASREPGPGAL